MTARDIALLGQSGTAVCLCPTTERDLADGVGPAAALRDAGCRIRLGTDSHAVVDLFEEARAVELDERLVSRRRGIHRPEDLLAAATGGGGLRPAPRPTCAPSTSTASGSPASTRTTPSRWSSPPPRRPT